MDYKIQSGDYLWKIAREQYGLKNNTEIKARVDQIARENNIKNPDLIFAGNVLSLSGLEEQTPVKEEAATVPQSTPQTTPEDSEPLFKSTANKFDGWSNSKDNYENYIYAKKEIDDFTLVEGYSSLGATPEERGKAYTGKIEEFSQEYISQYDEDKNGKLDLDEFTDIQAAAYKEMYGEEMNFNLAKDLIKERFDELNMNKADQGANEDGYVDAKEFATFFGMVDNMDGLIDGKMTYDNYYMANMVSDRESVKDQLNSFYNFFYPEEA